MESSRLVKTLLVVAIVAVAASGIVDDGSRSIAERTFGRALVTFAAARTLNGVISAAQGTEVALEPGGVGVVLSVGQVLDPINDLVEQFSSVMLIAASSLGLQNILLGISRWWGLSLALGLVAAAFLTCLWVPSLSQGRGRAILGRMFFAILFLRFVIPLLIIGTNLVSQAFLAEDLDESTAALDAATAQIEVLNEEPAEEIAADRSLLQRLGTMIDDSIQSMNATRRLEQLREAASSAAENIINLIVIFVLQTILLPLGLFWVLLQVVRGWTARLAGG